ncbi:MAG: penicillin-binding protein 1C [Alteromonadaceae bacterium]|nr:MAG: penicillin-binding protein 1C [Alteromonadaceae bacterium]
MRNRARALPFIKVVMSAFLVALIPALAWLLDRHYPLELPERQALFARVVVDDQNRPLSRFADKKGVWRYPVKLDGVSPYYLQALLSYEDQRFWQHPGIDPLALIRAMYLNIRHGRIISGGSTLSMQVARLLHPHSRHMGGKLYQILRTLQLEYHLSKSEILTLYCNIAPFGGTIEGVQAASYAYLNKPASDLSHAEAALLAVLPQAPTRFRPDLHPEKAEGARNKVLDRMQQLKVWSSELVSDAKQEQVFAFKAHRQQHAPLLSRRLLRQGNGQQAIYSTIDGDLQQALADYLKDYIERFPKGSSAAVLVVKNNSAQVKAYLGTADFANRERFGYVDMVQAIRSPGSTLKPFIYAQAMDAGLIHSKSLLADVPRTWGNYRPGNFNEGFSGPVSVTEALQRSLNLPVIDVLARLGERKFAAAMAQAGVPLTIPGHTPNLAIALGGAGISLEQLVRAYMALARGGKTVDLQFTQSANVSTVKNHQAPTPNNINSNRHPRYFMSPEAAWIVQDILSGVSRPGELHSQHYSSGSHSDLSWKTGTSYGFRDAWAIGVNAEYTIGIWLGRPDGTPIPGSNGRMSAGPLLFSVADHIGISSQPITKPENVVKAKICWPLGTLKSEQTEAHCQREHDTWLIKDSIPPTWHHADAKSWQANTLTYWYDPKHKRRINARCQNADSEKRTLALWPKVLQPWLPYKLRLAHQLPPADKNCKDDTISALSSSVHITSTAQGNTYRVNQSAQGSPIELHAVGGQGQHHWYVDGVYLKSVSVGRRLSYLLQEKGKHQLVVIDDAGQLDSVDVVLM